MHPMPCHVSRFGTVLTIPAPILITGFPRSGTSLVAGMFAACGAWTGECVPGGADNPRGFFENIRLRENITKKILGDLLKCDPLGIRSLPELDTVRKVFSAEPGGGGAVQNYAFKAFVEKELAADGYDGTSPWLYKDCKTSLLWPLWHAAWPDAKWVIVRRSLNEIVRSCKGTSFMRQHGLNFAGWQEKVEAYMDRLENMVETENVAWGELWPHHFMEGDFKPLAKMIEDCGLTFDQEACEAMIERPAWRQSPPGMIPLETTLKLNVGLEAAMENVIAALTRGKAEGFKLFRPEPPHGVPACIVGGGPSLKAKLPKLRKLQAKGAVVIACNGAHDYLLRHGIIPWAMIMMDAREQNAEFVKRPRRDVHYFMASQCHPSVFDALRDHQVVLWHSAAGDDLEAILRARGEVYGEDHMIVAGGNTIGLRAMNLAYINGVRDFHLFGMDSCYKTPKVHHAYKQTLNDGEKTLEVTLGDKTFLCSVWQAQQASEFKQWIEMFAGLVTLQVHGGGLLAAQLDEALEIYTRQQETKTA